MAAFDIIAASSIAYKNTWANRAYVLKLAMVPFAIRLICFTLAITYANGNFTWFTIIMLPAYLAQGWMLAHFVRYLVLGQTWPFRPTGDMDADLAVLSLRARGVLGGMIVFVLTLMVAGVFAEIVRQYLEPFLPVEGATQMEIPLHVGFFAVAALAITVWAFRLMWLNIPYALNMDGRTYLLAVKGAMSSMYFFAVWVLCSTPFILALGILSEVVAKPLAGAFGQGAATLAMVLFTVAADMGKSLLTTAGVTYALREVFTKQDKPRL